MNCLTTLIVSIMNNFMPVLPYDTDGLAPVISKETIEYHYGKHLQTYVNNLEKLTRGTALEGEEIEDLVIESPEGPVYNNAGQVLNHQLYFLQFTPNPRTDRPEGKLATLIVRDFGSFEELKKKMTEQSIILFGSGWVWLCMNEHGGLEITSCPNGDNPLRHGKLPLLGFDVWEHAYYLDYQNRRADHIARLWEIINWDEVSRRAE
ncbi:MAG: superoxide dismutase [Bacteroidaceae bacterium]|nr:superoxide dismutase [Bacteroidaceae bacterium]